MAAATATATTEEEKTLQEELAHTIFIAERLRKSAEEAESSKPECLEIAKQVDLISKFLRSTVRLVTSTPPQSLYDRPIRHIISDVSKTLDRAQTLVRRCRHTGFLTHVFSITTQADFRKVTNLLESSIADLKWLLSIFNGEGANSGLPPIASNDPIIAFVWSLTAALETGKEPKDRIESVNYLASFAKGNDRNKNLIVEEGAVPRILKLLKDGGGSAEGQIAAANALLSLVDDVRRTRVIVSELGVPLIVQVLRDSPMKVQMVVAYLVAKMAEVDKVARDVFGKENVMKPLVSCLLMDLELGDHNQFEAGRPNLLSIYQVNKELTRNALHHGDNYHEVHSSSGFRGGHSRKEREKETPELKHKLKTTCALALWRLCGDSLGNSRKIAEGKGLLCLSKIIKTEKGELQFNCLMTVLEIAAVAETNSELRKAAWKPSSPPAMAVLDQLLRVMKEETDPDFQVPAVKAIGCLARTFPARETRFIEPLVLQLGNNNIKVATEAAVALGKFVCEDNYNHIEHSKTIIQFNGVAHIMKLIMANNHAKVHGLVLLCHLSVNVGNSKALEEARALSIIEGAARTVVAQNPDLRELFAKAMYHLTLYHAGVQPHNHSYTNV